MSEAVARTVVRVEFGRAAFAASAPIPSGRIPRVARLLALAHLIHRMIATGEIRDWTHAALVCGVTRARISQVAGMLLLAPAIQEAILDLPAITAGRDPITERHLRPIAAEAVWERQIAMWRSVCRT